MSELFKYLDGDGLEHFWNKYNLRFITPEMFGAKGDGVADDTTALNSALSYAQEHGLPVVCNKTYLTTGTVTIRCDCEINGIIKYSGTGLAVLVGYKTENQNLVNAHVKIRVEASSFTDSTDSVGVFFGNTYNCDIYIDWVSKFYNGAIFESHTYGNAYNAVYISRIENYRYGLTLISNAGGWVNENAFYNGSFRNNTGFVYANNRTDILITSSASAQYLNNHNRFYNQCLEGAKIAADIEYGEYNFFYGIRTEGVETAMKTAANCQFNYMDIGYGLSASSFVCPGYVEGAKSKALKTMNLMVFDSGFLGREVAYNDNQASWKYLSTIGGQKESYKALAGVSDKGLMMQTGRYWRIGIDMSSNKTKRIRVYADVEWTGGRLVVLCLDSNGNDITTAPVYFAKSTTLYEDTTTWSGHTGYGFGSDFSDGDFGILQLPANTATCWICLYQTARTSPWYIKSVKVYSDSIATAIPTNGEVPTLTNIPTSTGYEGQFVRKMSPSSSEIGWRYINGSWTSVAN